MHLFGIRNRFIPFFSPGEEGSDGSQSGKIEFTPEQQAEVDRIVGQRLTSERAGKADYADLKEIADNLKAFGYAGTPAEIKAEVKKQADALKTQEEADRLNDKADEGGTLTPAEKARLDKIEAQQEELRKEREAIHKQTEDAKKAEDDWKAQVKEFETAHADIDMDKLGQNAKFMDFVKHANPNLKFLAIYDKYVELIGAAEAAAIEKIKANDDRSTFSGKSKADPGTGTYGLTENQQKLARQNDMTYKQYADSLKDIT